jgi:CheY-like chemotaxis protein
MEIFQVSVVTSGKQAITFLHQNKVDLVLLDYNMPEMPGPEVLKALRSNEETKKIPVAFLTGIDNKESISQVLALKPQGYILKSATKEALISKIDDVLRANPSQA